MGPDIGSTAAVVAIDKRSIRAKIGKTSRNAQFEGKVADAVLAR
jgi:hypothetical protein